MSIPSTTFFIDGPCGDPAYLNTRDHPRGVEFKHFVEELWRRSCHLADSHFREDARTHFHQRFWEMYLAVTLIEHDFDLKRYGPEGPEFYAMLGRGFWGHNSDFLDHLIRTILVQHRGI